MLRFLPLAVLVSAISISAYFRHQADQEAGSVPRGSQGMPSAPLRGTLVGLMLLYALLLALCPDWLAWSMLKVPSGLRLLGAALGVTALPLEYWTLRSLGRNVTPSVVTRADHQLVTSGPYQWIRHPLYSVGLLVLLAAG